MEKINIARVFLGGLLAGLILNIFEYVLNNLILLAGTVLASICGAWAYKEPANP